MMAYFTSTHFYISVMKYFLYYRIMHGSFVMWINIGFGFHQITLTWRNVVSHMQLTHTEAQRKSHFLELELKSVKNR